ncbi:ATP-binding protein [Streptomyces sp. BE20]|uniref:ATP-binding protein n=1 Tax=Streptomycetaceae TaxID=2062 RepID=UPI002E76750E|nr:MULTISPECIES: ATP-binding protein [unclassified Streptomyces]MED7950943.1 ATP-binding protein [Streptomyces sp. BE303]MEE1825185.1 ATP-binding protein [Streptomyces sp. BE20]
MSGQEPAMRALGWARALPVSGGVRAGRIWARRHLDELGWTERAPETADAVVLTISELITNSHVHARSDAELVLTWDGSCLYVSVHDASSQEPRPREAGQDAVSGRGMALIDALADTWQTRPDERGKTVTACFHPPGQPGH